MAERVKQAAAETLLVEHVARADGTVVEIVRPLMRVTGSGMVDEDTAASYLGVSARTLQRYRKQRCGPVYYTMSGKVWYKIADLDEYVALWRVDPLAG